MSREARMQSIDDLARVITELDPSDQQALLSKVARLNFEKGLDVLAEKYRARLAVEDRLSVPAEQIWADLRRFREQVAELDYPE